METLPIAGRYRPLAKRQYLAHQTSPLIEEYAYRWLGQHLEEVSHLKWAYLPIFWSSIESNCRHEPKWKKKWLGLNSYKMKRLMSYQIQAVRRSDQPVFTVCMHDDGVAFQKYLHALDDVLVFSAGGVGDISIPLLCDARAYIARERDVLVSFKGAIRHHWNVYPFRLAIYDAFAHHSNSVIVDTCVETSGCEFSDVDYIELMQRSEFSLCPRGYGRTSFRFYEAIQQGSIPIYVHDGEPWLPYREELDWSEICISVDYRDLAGLYSRLSRMSDSDKSLMREAGQRYLASHFSMEGAMAYIIRKLSQFNDGARVEHVRQSLNY